MGREEFVGALGVVRYFGATFANEVAVAVESALVTATQEYEKLERELAIVKKQSGYNQERIDKVINVFGMLSDESDIDDLKEFVADVADIVGAKNPLLVDLSIPYNEMESLYYRLEDVKYSLTNEIDKMKDSISDLLSDIDRYNGGEFGFDPDELVSSADNWRDEARVLLQTEIGDFA